MGFTAVTYGRDLARGFYSTLGNKLAALLYRSKAFAHTLARASLDLCGCFCCPVPDAIVPPFTRLVDAAACMTKIWQCYGLKRQRGGTVAGHRRHRLTQLLLVPIPVCQG